MPTKEYIYILYLYRIFWTTSRLTRLVRIVLVDAHTLVHLSYSLQWNNFLICWFAQCKNSRRRRRGEVNISKKNTENGNDAQHKSDRLSQITWIECTDVIFKQPPFFLLHTFFSFLFSLFASLPLHITRPINRLIQRSGDGRANRPKNVEKLYSHSAEEGERHNLRWELES